MSSQVQENDNRARSRSPINRIESRIKKAKAAGRETQQKPIEINLEEEFKCNYCNEYSKKELEEYILTVHKIRKQDVRDFAQPPIRRTMSETRVNRDQQT